MIGIVHFRDRLCDLPVSAGYAIFGWPVPLVEDRVLAEAPGGISFYLAADAADRALRSGLVGLAGFTGNSWSVAIWLRTSVWTCS